MEGTDILIEEYNKHPVNNFAMEDATITRHEGNFICGDDITVYLKINGDTIEKFSFDGNPSNITMAASSLLAELIEGQKIDDVMERSYDTMAANGFDVLPKRRRAAVIALLAVRNAIHELRHETKEGTDQVIVEEFEDLLDD
ncbi:MAG: iron-sulfur cluster assembly scaffold protein [Patescibacteria group bacterium]|nr:iron-sulfur cluster assembly scaffold protein [Patescibacteria group bacterium]